jgi:nucleoside-diphosphate-sugar epimerase
MVKVLVVGATGYIGSHIAEQLAIGQAKVHTAALVRNFSDGSNPGRIATLEKLKAAGVFIVEGSASAAVDELAEILKDYDTIVCAVKGCCGGAGGSRHRLYAGHYQRILWLYSA